MGRAAELAKSFDQEQSSNEAPRIGDSDICGVADYKLYMFDFDLTLADTTDTACEAYRVAISACGGIFAEDKLLEYLSVPLDITYEKCCKGHSKKTVDDFRKIFYDKTHSIIASTTKLYPDVLDCLHKLRDNGKLLGIVTNRDVESMNLYFRSVKDGKGTLLDLFRSVVGRDQVVGFQKPNKEPIEYCIKEVAKYTGQTIKKCECVYVGDAENDWLSAKNAGVDFIYIRRGGDSREALDGVSSAPSLAFLTGIMGKYSVREFIRSAPELIKLFTGLAKGVKNKEYVAVVGHGLSVSNGSFKHAVLEKLSKKNSSAAANDTLGFYEKCFEYAKRFGDSELKKELKAVCESTVSRNQSILGSLNFASYVSFCYDSILARYFEEKKVMITKSVVEIKCYDDLKNWDFFGDKVPIFNVLGTYDDRLPLRFPLNCGETLVAPDGSDEDSLLSFLRLVRLQKKAIYIGVDDEDYEIASKLLDNEGDTFKERILIRKTESKLPSITYGDRLTILNVDQTMFLKLLYKVYSTGVLEMSDFLLKPEQMPDWLYDIVSNPTETQAIDLFLTRVEEELNTICENSVPAIEAFSRKIDDAFHKIYYVKSHFIALEKYYQRIKNACDEVIKDCNKSDKMKTLLRTKINIDRIKKKRADISIDIGEKAQYLDILKREINIGLYGTSERVMDFLCGLASNPNIDHVNLFVSECASKRTSAYSDDYFYCKNIIVKRQIPQLFQENDNVFKLYVVSDVYMTKIISEKKIDILCFGVHTVFKNDNVYILRNIYGTKLLTEVALDNGVDVFFITEDDKFEVGIDPKSKRFYADNRTTDVVGSAWDFAANGGVRICSTRNEEIILKKGCRIVTETDIIKVE